MKMYKLGSVITSVTTLRTSQKQYNKQNNGTTHVLYISIHFCLVLLVTATCEGKIQGFMQNVSTQRSIFAFSELGCRFLYSSAAVTLDKLNH